MTRALGNKYKERACSGALSLVPYCHTTALRLYTPRKCHVPGGTGAGPGAGAGVGLVARMSVLCGVTEGSTYCTSRAVHPRAAQALPQPALLPSRTCRNLHCKMGARKGAGKGKTAGTGKGKAPGKGSLLEWACTTCGCGKWITKAYCRTREFDGSVCKGTRPPAWAAQANRYTLGELQAGPQTPAPWGPFQRSRPRRPTHCPKFA